MSAGLDEAITKAQQGISLVISDLSQAYKLANTAHSQPQGMSRRDNALVWYLAERLEAARKLQNDLVLLGESIE
jgi:hypothetical protein